MQVGAVAVNVNDSVGSILVRETGEGDVEHAGGESVGGTVNGGELVPVDPAGDVADFEPRAHEAVNGFVAEVGLELGSLVRVLVGHVNEVRGPLGLADQVVVHDAFGTDLEGGGSDDGGGGGLPVK